MVESGATPIRQRKIGLLDGQAHKSFVRYWT
jgi:hypothetical protein